MDYLLDVLMNILDLLANDGLHNELSSGYIKGAVRYNNRLMLELLIKAIKKCVK